MAEVKETKYGIRQLFKWNEQTVSWEPKLSSELSEDLKEANVPALAAGTTPVQYFSRFNADPKKRVAMHEPSLTAFARAWTGCNYLDDLQQKFWWMTKSQINALKRNYASQLEDAGVDYSWPPRRAKPKLTTSQIADFVSFVGADAPSAEVAEMVQNKAAARAEAAKKRAAKKAAKKAAESS